MTNLILFLNSFFSYLLLFIIIVALVIAACIIGAKWRKSKDRKLALSGGGETETAASGGEKA
ncbi:MAG: hypothetical protein NC341_03260 [Blautia sp.]|nr:hypothetical protein [Blautia sp.]MCM1200637.1 hypothetical protein [Bacteroides fragilis]